MAEFESTSVETTDVADPSEEVTGVEEQEVASPVSEESEQPAGRTEEDAAWARMRRESEQAKRDLEAAQRELAEIKASNEARESAFSRLTGKEDGAEIAALAEITGLSEDEVAEIYERETESVQKDLRIAELEERITSIDAERMMQADLDALRKIDPTLKDLGSLGPEFMRYMSAADPQTGEPLFTPEDAYWAVKGKEIANQATPPKEVGRVETGSAEKDYYTEAEIDAMSPEQLKTNWKKVFASWGR